MRKAASGSDSFVVTRRQAFACVAVLFATMLSLSAISHRLGHTSGFRAAQLSLSINSHLANPRPQSGGYRPILETSRKSLWPARVDQLLCGHVPDALRLLPSPFSSSPSLSDSPPLPTPPTSPLWLARRGVDQLVRSHVSDALRLLPSPTPSFPPSPPHSPRFRFLPHSPPTSPLWPARVDLLVRSHVSDAFLSPHPPFPSFPPIPPVFPPSSVFPPSLTPTSPLWPARVDLLVRSHVSDALHSPPIPCLPPHPPPPHSAFPDSPQTSPLWPARVDLLVRSHVPLWPARVDLLVRSHVSDALLSPSIPHLFFHLPFFSPPIAPVSPLTSPLWPARVDLLVRSHVSDAYFLIEVLFRSIEQMWPRGIGDVILVLDEGEIVVRDLVPPWVKVSQRPGSRYILRDELPGSAREDSPAVELPVADNYTTAPYIAIIDDDVVFNLKVRLCACRRGGGACMCVDGVVQPCSSGATCDARSPVQPNRGQADCNWIAQRAAQQLAAVHAFPLSPFPFSPSASPLSSISQVTPGLLFNLTEGKPIVIGSRNAQRNNWLPSTRWLVGQHAYFANFMVQLPFVFPRDGARGGVASRQVWEELRQAV
ncbi:unnamed protein product [Closterium sp. NIES-64]|nr:unnamed protein product [Closterium sp. NIES-64]